METSVERCLFGRDIGAFLPAKSVVERTLPSCLQLRRQATEILAIHPVLFGEETGWVVLESNVHESRAMPLVL